MRARRRRVAAITTSLRGGEQNGFRYVALTWKETMRLTTCAALMVMVMRAGPASADERRIAIESYVGARPAWAIRPVTQVRISMERWRFTSNPGQLKEMLGEKIVRPGFADPKFNVKSFGRQVQQGLKRVVDDDYGTAVHILAEAIHNADRNPILMCQNDKLRETKLDALIFLARAYHHLNRMEERDAAMTTVIRSYPSRSITATKYGPDAEEIYTQVKRGIDQMGSGILSIRVTEDPGAVVCIDDVIQTEAVPATARVIPGPHRVVIVGSSGESRQYTMNTRANSSTDVEIPWDVYSVLVTGDYVGLRFATIKDREQEGFLARKLAGTSTPAVMIAVLSARLVRRRVVVSGTLHAVEGGFEVRRGEVELDGKRDNHKLDQLAAYLGLQERGPDVHELDVNRTPQKWQPAPAVEEVPAVEERVAFDPNQLFPSGSELNAPITRGPSRSERSIKPMLLIAGGAASLSASTVLFYFREVEGEERAGMRATWIGLAAASAAMLGTVIATSGPPASDRPSVSIVPTGGGAFGHVRWSF